MAASSAYDCSRYTSNAFQAVPVYNASATTIYAGTLVMANSSGKALPATPTASVTFLGVARKTVEQPASGSLTVDVGQGVFSFENSASAALTAAYVGKPAYCEDDMTVKNAAGTNGFAVGIFLGFDPTTGKCIVDTTRRA